MVGENQEQQMQFYRNLVDRLNEVSSFMQRNSRGYSLEGVKLQHDGIEIRYVTYIARDSPSVTHTHYLSIESLFSDNWEQTCKKFIERNREEDPIQMQRMLRGIEDTDGMIGPSMAIEHFDDDSSLQEPHLGGGFPKSDDEYFDGDSGLHIHFPGEE